MDANARPRLGLALGSGSARGLAHIGVIRALEEAGIGIDLVCGSSMGAIVGAAYACERLDALESWARGLDTRSVARFLDISWRGRGGPLKGEQMLVLLRKVLQDVPVAALPLPFGAVAVDVRTGQVIWLREGPLIDVVRASAALPGLLPPWQLNGRWLVDGGLVDPVPVALCRAMGADVVIAVNLNAVLIDTKNAEALDLGLIGRIVEHLPQTVREGVLPLAESLVHEEPGYMELVANSLKIMQYHIANARLLETQPELLLQPDLKGVGMLAFSQAAAIIAAGRASLEPYLPALARLLEPDEQL